MKSNKKGIGNTGNKKVVGIMLAAFVLFSIVGGTVVVRAAGTDAPSLSAAPDGQGKQDSYRMMDGPGHHERPDPYLVWETQQRYKNGPYAQSTSGDKINDAVRTFPVRLGLPTLGTVRVPVFLIEFSDVPHTAAQTVADVQSKMFGSGDANQYPYDSIRNWYQRSSDNQLTITGDVYGWYKAEWPRAHYNETVGGVTGMEVLLEEALNYYDNPLHKDGNVDFAQYDNDNNGYIDNIFIKWTGETGEWNSTITPTSFWWGKHLNAIDSEGHTGIKQLLYDSKHVGSYVWSEYGTRYDPQTDIHETGHALGLPDLYDYNSSVGPRGGAGGLDMMDSMLGDFNSLFKMLLQWKRVGEFSTKDITIISSGSQQVTLRPNKDVVFIMPGASPSFLFGSEFFMVEYRSQLQRNDPVKPLWSNDKNLPTSGLVIWHIDSTFYGNNFKYDNQDTDHKLIRLMEADGLEEIQRSNLPNGAAYYPDAGDFYKPPSTFGPYTTPNSGDYAGRDTRVQVDQLQLHPSQSGITTMTARFSVFSDSRITQLYATASPTTVSVGQTITINGFLTADGAAVSNGLPVQLQRSTDGGTTWAKIGSATTDAGGHYSITTTESAAGQYKYKTTFAVEGTLGGHKWEPSESQIMTVTVGAGAGHRLTATASPPFLGTFTVSGSLTTATGEPISNGLVNLWKIEPLSGTWIPCPNIPDPSGAVSGQARTNRDGMYSFPYTEIVPGINTYKVKFEGDSTHGGCESKIFTVKI